jgi:dTDP-4-dehydrorhamnose reductase
MKNILVTGSNGQLGSELKALIPHYPNWNFQFSDLPELDICNSESVQQLVKDKQIDTIINCAAYTNVDKAETDIPLAQKVNSEGPGILAQIAKSNGLLLIHISTDFVFDGNKSIPYQIHDICNPLSVYGKTKWAGEKQIRQHNPSHLIIRTSWLYSSYGNNFVKTIQRLCNEREQLGIVVDQVGTPTYAGDLAKAILEILGNPKVGHAKNNTYHFSNEGVASWYDFAVAIQDLSGTSCQISPIPTSAYPLPAKRPSFSVMDKTTIKEDFKIAIRHWQAALKECIEQIKKQQV